MKKSYSTLQQALKLYQAENGVPLTPKNIKAHQVRNFLFQYFKVAKDCGLGFGDADSACVKNYDNDDKNSTIYTTYNGNKIDLSFFDDGQFILQDGSFILIENNTASPIYLSVDLNGLNNKPNRLGRDLFMFQINNEGSLLPMGAEGTTYYSENDEYCSETSTHNMNGAGCTFKALNAPDYFKNLTK